MYEAIILAGGLGTRLRSVVADIPKVMAPVAGKPFLHYIITKLIKENVSRIILAVGYKHEVIQKFIEENKYEAEIILSIEHQPLGTGGGIQLALEKCSKQDILIINGDSFFDCDLNELMQEHTNSNADISLALKPMNNFERYGTVTLKENRIIAFNEKKFCEAGLINAGIYVIRKESWQSLNLPQVFSVEKEVFEGCTGSLQIMGFVFNSYFIDIGIPEDFEKAQTDFH